MAIRGGRRRDFGLGRGRDHTKTYADERYVLYSFHDDENDDDDDNDDRFTRDSDYE